MKTDSFLPNHNISKNIPFWVDIWDFAERVKGCMDNSENN